MKKILISAAVALITATSAYSVSASPFTGIQNDPDVLVNKPVVQQTDEIACYGCISPSTGRIRNNYVSPHYRSNGTFVNGYWRS